MGTLFIFVIVVLVVVFAAAFRMDLKRRHLGDTKSGGALSKASRQTRREGKEKGERWGAGGG